MDKYTFEMIPGLIGEIAELLRSIDTKLDKLTAEPEPASAFPEWLNIKDLTAFMPTHPAAPTIYGWVRENLIPYYKRGKHLFFKRSEIETCKTPVKWRQKKIGTPSFNQCKAEDADSSLPYSQ